MSCLHQCVRCCTLLWRGKFCHCTSSRNTCAERMRTSAFSKSLSFTNIKALSQQWMLVSTVPVSITGFLSSYIMHRAIACWQSDRQLHAPCALVCHCNLQRLQGKEQQISRQILSHHAPQPCNWRFSSPSPLENPQLTFTCTKCALSLMPVTSG